MAHPFKACIVRIYSKTGPVVGAGFLVNQRQVMTCAHVVNIAWADKVDPEHLQDVELTLDFPLIAPRQNIAARLVRWQQVQQDGTGDMAGLELIGRLPADVKPARLIKAEDLWEHPFRAFGFPQGECDGGYATGVLRDQQATGWIQIDARAERGFAVQPGFSGGPVWDETVGGVVGMAVAADRSVAAGVAFVLPVKALIDFWSEIVCAESWNVNHPGPSSEAGQGISAVHDLREAQQVADLIDRYKTNFEDTQKQIGLLGDYKNLHDQLHELQCNCYNRMEPMVAVFPDNEMAKRELFDCAFNLEVVIEDLRTVAEESSVPKIELEWIDECAVAKADFRTALETSDSKRLETVVWRLKRLLANKPTRMNILLLDTVRQLDLLALSSTLYQIYKVSLDLDSEEVGKVRLGADALSRLDEELKSLVDEHNRWQFLDDELRRIEAAIEFRPTELNLSWSAVKQMGESLYVSRNEEWALDLKNDSNHLDKALAEDNPAMVRQRFINYHHHVFVRFHQADKKLKERCDDIRQEIDKPLALVLGGIQ